MLTALSNPENDSLVENLVVTGVFLVVCQLSNQFPILNIVYDNPWTSVGFLCLHIALGYAIFVLYSVYNMRRLKAFVVELQKDYAGLKPKCELNWEEFFNLNMDSESIRQLKPQYYKKRGIKWVLFWPTLVLYLTVGRALIYLCKLPRKLLFDNTVETIHKRIFKT